MEIYDLVPKTINPCQSVHQGEWRRSYITSVADKNVLSVFCAFAFGHLIRLFAAVIKKTAKKLLIWSVRIVGKFDPAKKCGRVSTLWRRRKENWLKSALNCIFLNLLPLRLRSYVLACYFYVAFMYFYVFYVVLCFMLISDSFLLLCCDFFCSFFPVIFAVWLY